MPRTKISLKKHAFFDKTANDVNISFKDYEFNLNQLKTEFSSLFQLFVSNKERLTNKSELVAYLAAVCDLMQGSRYLVKDFGTSKSPKSTRQRAKYFGRDCPASGTLR